MEIKIIKMASYEEMVRRRKRLLEIELDYLLLSLHDAIQTNDESEKENLKEELEFLVEELKVLQA